MADWTAEGIRILNGDVRDVLPTLPDCSVHCCVTSPPYWGLRDYGVAGQLGLEPTPEEYVENMVAVFREVRRVLREDGTLWLNLGDGYAGSWGTQSRGDNYSSTTLEGLGDKYQHARRIRSAPHRNNTGSLKNTPGLKPKDLCGIPWRLAFALQADGWYLRQDIIWHKPNPMPESVRDRCCKAHEYLFLLSKSRRYYFDQEAIKEPVSGNSHSRGKGVHPKSAKLGSGVKQNADFSAEVRGLVADRNKRSVWTVPSHPFSGAHFATFPPRLITPCILAGTSKEGCCPKCGAPWVRVVEKTRVRTRPGRNSKSYDRTTGKIADDGVEKPWRDRAEIGNRDPGRHISVATTTGWRPGCDCEAGDPVPCTVLDPFHGAGTTALVSLKHGRHYVGIELNPEYLAMSVERLRPVLEARKESLF